jgi:hypothetical protein
VFNFSVMWETSVDVLNMVLAISVGAVSFVLIFVLFYLVIVLRDVSFTSHRIKRWSEAVDEYIRVPMKIAGEVYKQVMDVMDTGGKKKKK